MAPTPPSAVGASPVHKLVARFESQKIGDGKAEEGKRREGNKEEVEKLREKRRVSLIVASERELQLQRERRVSLPPERTTTTPTSPAPIKLKTLFPVALTKTNTNDIHDRKVIHRHAPPPPMTLATSRTLSPERIASPLSSPMESLGSSSENQGNERIRRGKFPRRAETLDQLRKIDESSRGRYRAAGDSIDPLRNYASPDYNGPSTSRVEKHSNPTKFAPPRSPRKGEKDHVTLPASSQQGQESLSKNLGREDPLSVYASPDISAKTPYLDPDATVKARKHKPHPLLFPSVPPPASPKSAALEKEKGTLTPLYSSSPHSHHRRGEALDATKTLKAASVPNYMNMATAKRITVVTKTGKEKLKELDLGSPKSPASSSSSSSPVLSLPLQEPIASTSKNHPEQELPPSSSKAVISPKASVTLYKHTTPLSSTSPGALERDIVEEDDHPLSPAIPSKDKTTSTAIYNKPKHAHLDWSPSLQKAPLPPSLGPLQKGRQRSYDSKKTVYRARISVSGSPGLLSFDASSRATSGFTTMTRDIPASCVFKHSALPLHLPALDAYLKKIDPPKFTEPEKFMGKSEGGGEELKRWKEWVQNGDKEMERKTLWQKIGSCFGGMHRRTNQKSTFRKLEDAKDDDDDKGDDLEATEKQHHVLKKPHTTLTNVRGLLFPPLQLIPPKLTISDLFLNRSKPPSILTLDSVLGTAIDGVLGGEGSQIAITVINVEIFRDLIQMIAYNVGFIGSRFFGIATGGKVVFPHDTDDIAPWKRWFFVTIPSILSLDFISAFGKAIVFYWLFIAFTFLGCYEFWRMTGKGWGLSIGCGHWLPAVGLNRKGRKVDAAGGVGSCTNLEPEKEHPQNETENQRLRMAVEVEGFDIDETVRENKSIAKKGFRDARWYKITITFLICSLYMPLSKVSISALLWSSDFWAVSNPYLLTDYPTFTPLGPQDDYRDADDFCYTTTMKKSHDGFDNLNWAPLILTVSVINILVVTIWFPLRLWGVVKAAAPKVDPYTEMGQKRTSQERITEYQRVLDRDNGEFNFLYNSYRKEWAGFKAIYLAIKLATVIVFTVFSKDNCLFRDATRDKVSIIRQGVQLGTMLGFLIVQTITHPFVDRIQNNSDWVSRVGYVVIALIGLLVAIRTPASNALNGPILLVATILLYIFNGYFSIIRTGFAQRILKRIQKRLDFSIDLFSPHLDLSKHVTRRVWQETFSTILLAAPEYQMTKGKKLTFSQCQDTSPYLLGFDGSQGERHAENVQILRQIGYADYTRGVAKNRLLESSEKYGDLWTTIFLECSGPDCYWKPTKNPAPSEVKSFFGRAKVIPFPFSVCMKYDQSRTTYLISDLEDLRAYVEQNRNPDVEFKRKVRQALRVLEGRNVHHPHTQTELVGSKVSWPWKKPSYSLQVQTSYRVGVLNIERNQDIIWRGYNYCSGFNVTIAYRDGKGRTADGSLLQGRELTLDATGLGISDEFSISPTLATLLQENKRIIDEGLSRVQKLLQDHRQYFYDLANWKRRVLSYYFLMDVSSNFGLTPEEVREIVERNEQSTKIRNLPSWYQGSIGVLEERLSTVNRSHVTQFWYILWDDLWRRNGKDVPDIGKYPTYFNPHYRSSICYHPLSRPELEGLLEGLGLWANDGKKRCFNVGFINRIYLFLDQIVFESASAQIPIKVGEDHTDVRFAELDKDYHHPVHEDGTHAVHRRAANHTEGTQFTYDTGGGTDHDDGVIRVRHAFPFEEIYDDRGYDFIKGQRMLALKEWFITEPWNALKVWLGLTPVSHKHSEGPAPGVYFSLRKAEEGWEIPTGLKDTRSSAVFR